MMTTMRYEGYEATFEFDADAGIFHGEVANVRDVVTFQAATAGELKQAFADSVNDYVAFCLERGEDAGKPF